MKDVQKILLRLSAFPSECSPEIILTMIFLRPRFPVSDTAFSAMISSAYCHAKSAPRNRISMLKVRMLIRNTVPC